MIHSVPSIIRYLAVTAILLTALTPVAGFAQDTLPQLPEPIQNLVNEGAQIRYLGNDHGVDAWITIKNGQEQYFYVLPGGGAFLMGVMFDKTGQLVTVDQVRKLRDAGDDMLDTLTDEFAGMPKTPPKEKADSFEFKSPSERLFFDIENSNWVPLGEAGAPVMYSFIDPQCPHCHAFVDNLKETYLDKGKVQLRMIPIGFKDETRSQAAYLLAAPNPQAAWYAHLEGGENALPARAEINQQGVQRNLAILQSWKLNVTPLIIYRGKDGSVKIVRGQPKDLPALINDLGARS